MESLIQHTYCVCTTRWCYIMNVENMLWFHQRKRLEDLFIGWALENDLAQTPMNMVAWLLKYNLLNVDAAIELIKKENKV